MNSFDESFDFVVVGSGAGSLCASLYLRRQNKKVVVLEKSEYLGGTTARSGGVMWIPNNPFLKRDGVEDSVEKAITYLEGLAEAHSQDAPGATPERRRAYVTQAPEMIEFLLDQGIEIDRVSYWPDYYDERPGGHKTGRSVVADYFDLNELGEWRDKLRDGFLAMPVKLEEALKIPFYRNSWHSRWIMLKVACRFLMAKLAGKRYTSTGAALQGRLLKAALGAGADIRLKAPVSELIVEDGAVKGVLTERDGKPWRIAGTLGVLVNAGGFSRNQRMRDRYQPGTTASWSSTPPCDTGEMIEEMMRIGAAVAQMEEMVGNPAIMPPGTDDDDIKEGHMVTAKPHAILVDQSGARYMNECSNYMDYCRGMLERNATVAAVPSWVVFDSQFLRKYMLAGTWPGVKKPDRWYTEGFLKKADTLQDLAKLIDVDPAALAATVARFNGFVDGNRDEDYHRGESAYDNWLGDPFHKPSPTLGRIEQGPFYAVAMYPGDVGTFGGVVTDQYARVLREDGSVIAGLYATGVSTASVMGRSYPGAGASVGPAMTFGYIAAKHAASEY